MMGFYKDGKYVQEPTDVGYNDEWDNPKEKKTKTFEAEERILYYIDEYGNKWDVTDYLFI